MVLYAEWLTLVGGPWYGPYSENSFLLFFVFVLHLYTWHNLVGDEPFAFYSGKPFLEVTLSQVCTLQFLALNFIGMSPSCGYTKLEPALSLRAQKTSSNNSIMMKILVYLLFENVWNQGSMFYINSHVLFIIFKAG